MVSPEVSVELELNRDRQRLASCPTDITVRAMRGPAQALGLAAERTERDRPVQSDIRMPGITGEELAIGRAEWWPGVPTQ